MSRSLAQLLRHPLWVLLLSFALTSTLAASLLNSLVPAETFEEPMPAAEEISEVVFFTEFYSDLVPPIAPPPEWERYTFQPGDRLSDLWPVRFNLPNSLLYQILQQSEGGQHLNRIRPGQEIEWLMTRDGRLVSLRLWTSSVEALEWNRQDQDYAFRQYQLQRQTTRLRLEGQLTGTLSETLLSMPETEAYRAALVAALDRHLPLRRDARDGDRFTLLLEQEWVADMQQPYATQMQAFSYEGARVSVSAARHLDGRFYTPEGISLIPPFDRIPLRQRYRISDHFNSQRLHPVLRIVRPHYGTDFATPIGTPVLAPADGVVVRSRADRQAGRFLQIDHGQGYVTRYLHLSRLQVREGEQVRRGQQIALSGNTGITTGPHLHYELIINGRPVDAMRAELPSTERLAGQDLQRFQQHTQPLFAELNQGSSRLAQLDTGETAP